MDFLGRECRYGRSGRLVTLRAFGTAVITARYRSYSARCTVATLQEPPLDPSAALGAPLSDDIVYSKNVVLYAPRRIMQGFDLTDGGEIYYSQISSDGTSVIVCRAAGPGQDARAEYMTLKYFGHGTADRSPRRLPTARPISGSTATLRSTAAVNTATTGLCRVWNLCRVHSWKPAMQAKHSSSTRTGSTTSRSPSTSRPAGCWSVRASPGCVTFGFSTSTRRWLCRSRR